MQNTAFNSRAFRCPAFEPMFPLMGGVESAYAVGFDGSNDYIDLGSPSALQITGDITFSFWVKRNGASDFEWVFVNEDSNGYPGVATILFYNSVFNNGSGSKTIYFYRGNGSNAQGGVISASTIPVGVWTHIACTCSGTTYSIYINGQINNTATYAGTVTAKSQFVIGKRIAGANGWHFPGVIDDFRIYNRALTAAEVQSIYRNSSSPPTDGLVAYFPLDEGTGTTITDTVGGLVGTLTNGPTWEPQVCPRLKTGRDTTQSWGVSFDGTNDYIQVPDSNLLDATNGTSDVAITVSAWIKPTNVAADRQIVAKRKESVTNGCEWWMGYGSSYINFSLGDGSNSTNRIGRTSPALLPNVWSHVVGTYDGTGLASGVKIYVNGFRVDNANDVGGSYVRTRNSDAPVTIGCYINNSAVASGICLGLIKDVRIYNSALSAADIAKLSNNIPISATPVGHWKLDDGTSTTATDSSGNGNHGTLTNGPAWSGDIPQWFRPTIESSYAASFDGSDDYISVPNSATLNNLASLSILAFVYLDTLNSPGAMVLSKDAAMYLQLGISGFVTFQHGSGYTQSAVAVISTGKWQHHAGTFDGSNLRYYLNGSASGTPAASTPPTGMDDSMWIGAYSANGGVAPISYWLDGIIDELCIYNVALPAAAIADAAAGYLVSAGLISRYKLDNNANDAHGTNHGTEQGGVGYSTNVPGTL